MPAEMNHNDNMTHPRVEAAMEAVAEILRSLGESESRSNLQLQVLRSENDVVLSADDTIVVKAIERTNSQALDHEASVIEALAGSTAPVVRPSHFGLGPFQTGGWKAILLEKMDELPLDASSADLVRSLTALHRALSAISIELPNWTAQLERTVHAWKRHPFTDNDQQTAELAYARYVQPSFTHRGPTQPIHGDAWSGQVIRTASGLRWIDFESACIGPPEWDLASFDDPTGYGDFDENLWQRLRLVKSWSVAVWCNIHQTHSPRLAAHIEHHLSRLADHLP